MSLRKKMSHVPADRLAGWATVVGIGIGGGLLVYRERTASVSTTPSSSSASTSTSTSPTKSSSPSSSTACKSPYGCSESSKPTNCPGKSSSMPLGSSPVWHSGYGWVCQENGTATQQFLSGLPAMESQTKTSGDPIATYGTGVSGSNAKANALALQQKLAIQYPNSGFQVYYQNGQYNVLPASRVKYLQSIGGTPGTLVS